MGVSSDCRRRARDAYLTVLTVSMRARSALKVPSALVSEERFWKGMEMPFLVGATGAGAGLADAIRARATVIKVALQNMVGAERTSCE